MDWLLVIVTSMSISYSYHDSLQVCQQAAFIGVELHHSMPRSYATKWICYHKIGDKLVDSGLTPDKR